MSEVGIPWDMRKRDTGIEAVIFSLLLISDYREESLQIGELLQVSEQLQKEEADGIIGVSSHGRVG